MFALAKSYLKFPGICALLLGINSFSVLAADPDLKTDRPESHTVVSGDTLWGISARFLEDPWRWKEIWQGNSQIANPDLIYPGDVIRLIFVDGKPQLVVNDTTSDISTEVTEISPKNGDIGAKKQLKTVKLSPKVYATPLKKAIPTIPLEKINNFLSRNRVVEEQVLEKAPHILAAKDQRVILSAGLDVYARGNFVEGIDSYGIYRGGFRYIDPVTEEVLGIQAIDIGSANIKALQDDVATFAIVRSTNEVRIGDRLLPSAARKITASFTPEPVAVSKSGEIMAVERGVSQAGKLDIIAINLGEREGLSQGSLLGIFKKGKTIRDRNAQRRTSRKVDLPDERAGLVMVFQTFSKMSLGIILEAEHGVVLGDIVDKP